MSDEKKNIKEEELEEVSGGFLNIFNKGNMEICAERWNQVFDAAGHPEFRAILSIKADIWFVGLTQGYNLSFADGVNMIKRDYRNIYDMAGFYRVEDYYITDIDHWD